jgi:hypothetical protein
MGIGRSKPVEAIETISINDIQELLKETKQKYNKEINNIDETIIKIGFKKPDEMPLSDDSILDDNLEQRTIVNKTNVRKKLSDVLKNFKVNMGPKTSIIGGLYDNTSEQDSIEDQIYERSMGGAEVMHSDVLNFQKMINSKLSDLNELKSYLDESIKKMAKNNEESIKNCNNESEKAKFMNEFEKIKKVVDVIMSEVDKSIGVLNALIGHDSKLQKTKLTLESLINANKKIKTELEKMDNKHEDTIGKKISVAYMSISDSRSFARKVNDALEEVGMKWDEYVKIKNKMDLNKKVLDLIKKIDNPDKIIKKMKALDLISSNFEEKHKLMSEISKKGGEVLKESKVKKIIKRMKDKQDSIIFLFNTFVEKSHEIFNNFKHDFNKIAPLIGDEIPYDKNMEEIIKLLTYISESYEQNIYYELLELDEDISKDKKNIFIDYLKSMKNLLNNIYSSTKSNSINNISKNVQSLLELIDVFSDNVKKINYRKYEVDDNETSKSSKKGGKPCSTIDEISLRVDKNSLLSSTKTIQDVSDNIQYYGKVAEIKKNLQIISKNSLEQVEDYKKLLGKSIGDMLNENHRLYNYKMNDLENTSEGRGKALKDYNNRNPDNRISKESICQIYRWQFEAKEGLYKAIEAIDLYLSYFTNSITKNPSAINDLDKLLKETEIISKWYLERSGDNFIRVFESFPNDQNKFNTEEELFGTSDEPITYIEAVQRGLIPSSISNNHIFGERALNAFKHSKNAFQDVVILKNIISTFINIGKKFGNEEIIKKIHMSPSIIYDNLFKYLWVSAFTIGSTHDTSIEPYSFEYYFNVIVSLPTQVHSMSQLKNNDNNMLEYLDDDVSKLKYFERKMKQMEESSNNINKITYSLDSLSHFIKNLKRIRDQITLTNSFNEAIKLNLLEFNKELDDSTINTDQIQNYINADINNYNIEEGNNYINNVLGFLETKYAISDNKTDDEFIETDFYFILAIKSMVSKIFTVIGLHGLFSKPNSQNYELTNPVRLVIGGSDEVVVIDEVVELYIRIPLLMEFYRNIFNNGNKEFKNWEGLNDDSQLIAFVPESGSIWSNLIKIVFDKSKYIENGIYDSQNIKDMIVEINNIYKHYNSKTKREILVREVCLGLVDEINRRYGIVKRSELAKMYVMKDTLKSKLTTKEKEKMEFIDYEILEETSKMDSAAPSNQFTSYYSKYYQSQPDTDSKKMERFANIKNWFIIKEFRDKISEQFKPQYVDELSNKTFKKHIEFYKTKIIQSKDNKEKYNIITEAIDRSTNANVNIYTNMMFHEMVTTPLQILNSLYHHCKEFTVDLHNLFMKNSYFANLDKKDNSYLKPSLEIYDEQLRSYVNYNDPAYYNIDKDFYETKSLKKFIDLIYLFTSTTDGLVTMKFINKNKITLDTTKLEKYVSMSIENIKHSISKFRTLVNPESLARYENEDMDGSVYYLERRFLEKLIRNKFNKIVRGEETKTSKSDHYINNFNSLVYPLSNYPVYFPTNNSLSVNEILLWKDDKQSEIQPINESLNIFKDIFRKYDRRLKNWVPAYDGGVELYILKGRYVKSLDGMNTNIDNGLVTQFNKILGLYLEKFYEPSTKRIYAKLFNSFSNESFSNIMSGEGLSDMGLDGTLRGIIRRYPKNRSVITSSLAYTIKSLNTRPLKPQETESLLHLDQNLLDVSPHMIEQYRTYLPTFIKLFENIVQRAKLLSQVLENDIVDVLQFVPSPNIPNNPLSDTGGRTTVVNMDGEVETIGIDSDSLSSLAKPEIRTLYMSYATNLIDSCHSILQDANSVIKELDAFDKNVKPTFFDIKKNFISNYYNNNNKLPFMPFSHITYLLNPNNDSTILLPKARNEINESKFVYGTRALLNGPESNVTSSDVLYMKQISTLYNTFTSEFHNIDMKNTNDMLNINTKFMRFISEQTFIKSHFISSDLSIFKMRTINMDQIIPLTYQMSGIGIQRIISLTEEYKPENSIKTVNDYNNIMDNGQLNLYGDRKQAILLNIIDMNIIPINIHSMTREIPLVNIYNYAYTFDNIIEKDLNKNPTFIQLMKQPYSNFTELQKQELERILSKNMTELSLYKPKYLSDQIWDKIMLKKLQPDRGNDEFSEFMSDINEDKVMRVESRLDTKVMRNVIFLINIQRLIRIKLKNEIQYINSAIVSGQQILSDDLTEFSDETQSQKLSNTDTQERGVEDEFEV